MAHQIVTLVSAHCHGAGETVEISHVCGVVFNFMVPLMHSGFYAWIDFYDHDPGPIQLDAVPGAQIFPIYIYAQHVKILRDRSICQQAIQMIGIAGIAADVSIDGMYAGPLLLSAHEVSESIRITLDHDSFCSGLFYQVEGVAGKSAIPCTKFAAPRRLDIEPTEHFSQHSIFAALAVKIFSEIAESAHAVWLARIQ
jgi:hypothetical protein